MSRRASAIEAPATQVDGGFWLDVGQRQQLTADLLHGTVPACVLAAVLVVGTFVALAL